MQHGVYLDIPDLVLTYSICFPFQESLAENTHGISSYICGKKPVTNDSLNVSCRAQHWCCSPRQCFQSASVEYFVGRGICGEKLSIRCENKSHPNEELLNRAIPIRRSIGHQMRSGCGRNGKYCVTIRL